jgi:outer membrane protein assembly factor BamA
MTTTKLNNQFFLRINAETAGNIPRIIDNATQKLDSANGYYERFGVRYAQYVRFDGDYRRYWKLRYHNLLAFRLMAGIALPYGNSVSIPFEKSFWLGGANDMRGWRLRSLGPGGYSTSAVAYDKTGDIMLQASLEQRFPIYSFLLGSLFIDAGNIWLRNKSDDYLDGNFKLNTFYKQIAMDMGVGLRFDFSFFIFRLDAAIPFHEPASADKWFNKDVFKINNTILNFGIGYPF